MSAEHFRPVGTRTDIRVLAQGYWCPRCGEGGMSMYGHKPCVPNPALVHRLAIVNSPTWSEHLARAIICQCDCGCEPCDPNLPLDDPEQWHSEPRCACRGLNCGCVVACGCIDAFTEMD
jgi:hypothetical protein